jgi:hypothetical protein
MFVWYRLGRAVVRRGVTIMAVFDVDVSIFAINSSAILSALGGI